MTLSFSFRVFVAFAVCLAGCGKKGETASEDAPAAMVQLLLPTALTGDPQRYDRFRSRVRYLDLRAIEADGTTHEKRVAPGTWERLSLQEWAAKLSATDRWRLQAKVWDIDSRGELRTYPALSGEIVVKKEELASDRLNVLPLKLSLKVSVREYD